jgi:predicted RNA-binding Zn-ribbon protein involved in translation (DUF1610 family)
MRQRENQITEEQLVESYNRHKHLGKMAAEFKLPTVQIWRLCKKQGLDFSLGGKNEKIPLSEIFEGLHPYFQTGKVRKKILQEKAFEYVCVECGISEWNGKKIALQLDHIDGDSSNHRKENLRFLCPNCHSQTDTWCGRNK